MINVLKEQNIDNINVKNKINIKNKINETNKMLNETLKIINNYKKNILKKNTPVN
tara:strand:+ start:115 stop:279 length:165 start_codon:yes stop_codon:yes gene_type:complete